MYTVLLFPFLFDVLDLVCIKVYEERLEFRQEPVVE
jgi:hypothetical protein